MPAPTHVQTVFIVRADRPDLYEYLREHLGDTHRVILDRRGERDRIGPRRGEQRQPLTAAERKLWRDSGYFVIFQPVTVAGSEHGRVDVRSLAVGVPR